MVRNYLTVALRHLRKQAGYAFINIFGLGIGLAACVLILLYVQDELRYDRYHEHADQIYRVGLEGVINGRGLRSASTPAPMAAALKEEYPEVAQSTRIWDTGRVLISRGDHRFYEEQWLWADSTVFDVFTWPLLEGDPATALTEPHSVVLTASTARKYFGDENPVGQTLQFENDETFRVTGVVADVPAASHFTFDFVASIVSRQLANNTQWVNNNLMTYLRLREGYDAEDLQAKFPDLVRKYVAPEAERLLGQSFDNLVAAGLRYGYFLQPLTAIHLYSDVENDIAPQSSISYVYILSAVALFILLIACINFMNLATARSAGRAKEVGMRKVLGSSRQQLVRQFLGESILLAGLALLVALVLIVALLPAFNGLTGKALSPGVGTFGMLVGIALLVGLSAGAYPALVLSAFAPAAVLKGALRGGARGGRLRSVLVVTQFAISIALLVGTGVVFDQLRYMQNKRLGFAKEQVVVLNLETDETRQNFETLRTTLLSNPNVVQAAVGTGIPGHFNSDTVFRPEGAPDEQVFNFEIVYGSHEYLETLGMELLAGRTFSREHGTDADAAYVVNETAAREMGWTPEEAVGKQFGQVGGPGDGTGAPGRIVGVVRDFHFESLHMPIRGAVIRLATRGGYYLPVRIRPDDVPATLAFLEERMLAYQPNYPFAYTFLDEDFGRLYAQEARLGQIYGYFTLFAIFVACLGLFGLASFVTEQRTKEIGVRKVLGATVPSIVVLLSKEFTRLVLVAAVIAFPLAYVAMDRWLQDFAYRVDLHWYVFALAGLVALVTAWGTVSYQSVRAAVADPVKSLRYE